MRRLSLYLFVFFFVNICASAQIQRKFFDFELGKASKKEVATYFKSEGKELKFEYDNKSGYVDNIRFGGIKWDDVILLFPDDKLCVISFSDNALKTDEKHLDDLFLDLFNLLSEKYLKYRSVSLSSENEVIFIDEDTKLSLSKSYIDNIKTVSLTYTDRNLQRSNQKKAFEDF